MLGNRPVLFNGYDASNVRGVWQTNGTADELFALHELWTTRPLARHAARQRCDSASCLENPFFSPGLTNPFLGRRVLFF
jgi:hypothetical protein